LPSKDDRHHVIPAPEIGGLATATAPPTVGRVLVADEDPRDLRPLGSLLDGGYELIRARSGQEVLALLATRGASPERVCPDVVLLDATVPGLSGFEVCERLRTLPDTRHVPIVLVTAMASPDERARAMRSGADEILSRPVDPIELLTRVRSLFRFKRLRDEREAARREFESRRAEVGPPAGGRASLADLVAQDLIDPLVRIMASAQALETTSSGWAHEIEEHAGRILTASRLMQRRLSDLLEMDLLETHRRTLRLERLDLRETALLVVEDLRERAELSCVEIELGPPQQDQARRAPVIKADAGLMIRALGVLVGEAIKEASPGGTVRLIVSPRRDDRMEVHVANSGAAADAAGARPDAQIPEPSTDDPGLDPPVASLGLALSRMAIEAHGGRLWMKRNAVGGRTFGILMPTEPGAA
jgi:CheY-like chemotaxis protein